MRDFEELLDAILRDSENKYDTVAFDVDGTLTRTTCWTEEDVLRSIPYMPVVERVRTLHKLHYIIIWTARQEHLRNATEKWLHLHDIPYHLYDNKKNPYAVYIDDRSINPNFCMLRNRTHRAWAGEAPTKCDGCGKEILNEPYRFGKKNLCDKCFTLLNSTML